MGMLCLDTEGCNFQNRDTARFCAQCGIPLKGALVQGRYETQALIGKNRAMMTLRALDRHEGRAVTLRALLPKQASKEEREAFLQDAELAMSLSNHVQEAGSIHVTDYGQDGPLTFLVKSEYLPDETLASPSPARQQDAHPSKSQMTARVEENIFPLAPFPPAPPVTP